MSDELSVSFRVIPCREELSFSSVRFHRVHGSLQSSHQDIDDLGTLQDGMSLLP